MKGLSLDKSIIERKGEYTVPVCSSLTAAALGHDLYNHLQGRSLAVTLEYSVE